MLVVTVAALVWANVASDSYESLWHFPLGGGSFVRPLHFWINDGLMTVFFLVVGLEIRRETVDGELSTLRKAALPLAAALGGMLVPVGIFMIFNAGRSGAGGWAIPMATDIAFAVGVLTLIGSRVPASLRVLLLALAVIDDIGAIIVIAVFYSGGLSVQGVVPIALGFGVLWAMRRAGVSAPLLYALPGALIWVGLMATGIHPAIAGILLGLLTPPRRIERLIRALQPWVTFGVMPLFALANAGVVLGETTLHGDYLSLFLGIVVGLAVGKPLGIFAASLAATRTMTKRGLLMVGMVGGIGFTMSLFVAQLAFPPGALLDTAKLAILVGSGISIAIGLCFGLAVLRKPAPA